MPQTSTKTYLRLYYTKKKQIRQIILSLPPLTDEEKKLLKKFIAKISTKISECGKITRGEFWKIAANFTGKPYVLPDNLFKVVYVLSWLF